MIKNKKNKGRVVWGKSRNNSITLRIGQNYSVLLETKDNSISILINIFGEITVISIPFDTLQHIDRDNVCSRDKSSQLWHNSRVIEFTIPT